MKQGRDSDQGTIITMIKDLRTKRRRHLLIKKIRMNLNAKECEKLFNDKLPLFISYLSAKMIKQSRFMKERSMETTTGFLIGMHVNSSVLECTKNYTKP